MTASAMRFGKRIAAALFALLVACSVGMAQSAHADEGSDAYHTPRVQVVTLKTTDGASTSGVVVAIDGEYLFLTEDELLPLSMLEGWSEAMLEQATAAIGRAAEGEHGMTGPGVVVKEQKDAWDYGEILFVEKGDAQIATWQQASGATEKRLFDDVAADSWVVMEGWLEKALDANIVSGYKSSAGSGAKLFGPDDPVTRGQLLTMLYRATVDDASASLDAAKYATNTVSAFRDNADNQFYTAAINWAYDAGIVTGDADASGAPLGTVRPDDPISRQEMATVLHRFAGEAGARTNADESFSSVPDTAFVAGFASEGVAWCFANGIMTGDKSTGKLMPAANATRAQTCKTVVATLELMKADDAA